MNGKIERTIDRYSDLIFERPGTVLAVVIVVTLLLASGASSIETEQQNQEDLLPDSVPAIAAFNVINAEFSSAEATTYTVLMEASPNHPNSNEIRDVRDPEVLRFTEAVSNDLSSREDVSSVSSPAGLFNDIPSSKRSVQQALETLGENRWQEYISEDYQAARMQVSVIDLTAEEEMEMAGTIRDTVEMHDKPAGLEISYTGQAYIDEAFQQQTQDTMSTTATAALVGVVLTVIILFRSIFYGLNSLLTLVFGIAAGFGIFGLLGLNMSPATSGAISMGIGIAIDFGIQPIARYIEERKDLDIQNSLSEMFKGVITPMTVGLIAANIGFLTLSVGQVTFLSDLGILLTLTTTMAYVSAFTVIPPSIVLYDRYFTGDDAKGFTLSKFNTKGDTQDEN